MKSWTSPDVPVLPALPQTLQLHDTSRDELVDVAAREGLGSLYVCGITPYDATHLGHASTYVAFDLLNRYWRAAGLEVAYVQNVTDVDDPLLERADRDGVEVVLHRVERVEADLFTRTRELERLNAELREASERERRTAASLAGLAATVSAVFDLLQLTLDSGRRELQLVQAQEAYAHPRMQFEVTRVR